MVKYFLTTLTLISRNIGRCQSILLESQQNENIRYLQLSNESETVEANITNTTLSEANITGADNAAPFESSITDTNSQTVLGMWFSDNQGAAIAQYGDISEWNISAVTTLDDWFNGRIGFNEDISLWDVSSVNSMQRTFEGAKDFDADISSWQVSGVTTMKEMFQGAEAFNQNISEWDVSLVNDMTCIFCEATTFDHSLCWNVNSNLKIDDFSYSNFVQCLMPVVCDITEDWNEWGILAPTKFNMLSFADIGNFVKFHYQIGLKDYQVDLFTTCDMDDISRVLLPDTVMKMSATDRSTDICKEVDVAIEVDVGKMDVAGIYSDNPTLNTGRINFCAEMALFADAEEEVVVWGVENPEENTEVTFQQLDVAIDVSFDAEMQISGIQLMFSVEEAVTTETQMEYEVDACQCNLNGTCFDLLPDDEQDLMTPTTKLFICLEVTAEDITIGSIDQLDLMQGDLSLPAIDAGEENTLTSVEGIGTQSIVITTQLVAAFFKTFDVPVSVVGAIVLEFEDIFGVITGRKLKFSTSVSRKLPDQSEEYTFSVTDIGLVDPAEFEEPDPDDPDDPDDIIDIPNGAISRMNLSASNCILYAIGCIFVLF